MRCLRPPSPQFSMPWLELGILKGGVPRSSGERLQLVFILWDVISSLSPVFPRCESLMESIESYEAAVLSSLSASQGRMMPRMGKCGFLLLE